MIRKATKYLKEKYYLTEYRQSKPQDNSTDFFLLNENREITHQIKLRENLQSGKYKYITLDTFDELSDTMFIHEEDINDMSEYIDRFIEGIPSFLSVIREKIINEVLL
tara:strand:- start:623 stop:946 length:324 start_codon:yes stop_codon:yes gene_type:complete